MAEMEIRPPSGSRKKKRISGRGAAGRRGVTAGKGDKGQNSRSGGGVRPGFEGGQMPLYRRIPRKGFSNHPFKKIHDVVNIGTIDKKYTDGETVTIDTLKEKRIVKKKTVSAKILGTGELTKKLTVDMPHVSSQARMKIEKAGGKVLSDAPEGNKIATELQTDTGQKVTAGVKACDSQTESVETESEPSAIGGNAEDSAEEKGSVDGE